MFLKVSYKYVGKKGLINIPLKTLFQLTCSSISSYNAPESDDNFKLGKELYTTKNKNMYVLSGNYINA